jgi:hypothetical protein
MANDMLTFQEVADELHLGLDKVYELAHRKDDPLPSVKVGKDVVDDASGKVVREGIRKVVRRHMEEWQDRQAGVHA